MKFTAGEGELGVSSNFEDWAKISFQGNEII